MNKEIKIGPIYDADPKQYKDIWNRAIEAAIDAIEKYGYHFTADEVRKLKR
jgi:hypothetical protein